MIFPEPMRKAVVAVLEEDAQILSRSLLEMGVVHFSPIQSASGKLGHVKESTSETEMAELRKRIENILSTGNSAFVEPEIDSGDGVTVDLPRIERRINSISSSIQKIRSKQGALETEARKLLDMRRQMELFGDVGKAAAQRSTFSFLDIRFGTVQEGRVAELEEALKALSAVAVRAGVRDDRAALLVISMKRDESSLVDILGGVDWIETEIPADVDDLPEGVSSDFETRISAIRSEQDKLATQASEEIDGVRDELTALWSNLRVGELLAQIRSHFSTTARTMLFSGWIPERSASKIEETIQEVTQGRCFIEWGSPANGSAVGADSPPVKLSNPKFLAPFQMLVENFSTPAYRSIDPTPIVAVIYLCMFGLMFADAGQGLVLLAVGIIGQMIHRKTNATPMNLLDLIAWCGGAAIISGILFGSYFGYPLFDPIWFDYHGIVAGHAEGGVVDSVYGILGITVWFGVGVIGLGLLLNWINLAAKKNWVSLVFDKGGVVGGWIFFAGVAIGRQFVASGFRSFPGVPVLAVLVGIPVVLLAFKAPLSGHHGPTRSPLAALMDYAMEWIVEILETFSGYLANVLSFMRVAGLGIAHASLMIAFDTIARSASTDGGVGFASILILVLGNLLVIGLEGLSAGIQSLRLNYYEFFSKYFDGSGKSYAPISLRGGSGTR